MAKGVTRCGEIGEKSRIKAITLYNLNVCECLNVNRLVIFLYIYSTTKYKQKITRKLRFWLLLY